jgi:hypothetical protein
VALEDCCVCVGRCRGCLVVRPASKPHTGVGLSPNMTAVECQENHDDSVFAMRKLLGLRDSSRSKPRGFLAVAHLIQSV